MMNRWFPLWIIPLLLGFSAGTIWLRLSVIKTSYAIAQTDKNLKSLQDQKNSLELRVTNLKSPKRLELLAKAHFNLAPPKVDQVVHLK